jgi:hypothetical protein
MKDFSQKWHRIALMKRTAWISLILAALCGAGCHKKPPPIADNSIVFTSGHLAAGSTGDTMAQMALQYGIPTYPGSVPDSSHFNAAANTTGRVYMAYTSPDPTDRIVTFYKANLNMGATTSGAITILSGMTKNGSSVTIDVGQKMDGSGTTFSIIVSPTQPEPYNNNVQASATAPAAAQIQIPAPVAAPKDVPPQDTTTYYVPTANSPEDNSSGNVTGGGDGTQTDQTGGQTSGAQGQDQTTGSTGQQTQDGGPPGG